MKFRKKPVVIEAEQVTAENLTPMTSLGAKYHSHPMVGVEVQTLEGWLQVKLGDWIIRGVKGEFYPCKPDIFEATYEPMEEP